MAAPTVTLDFPVPGRLGNTVVGVLSGSVNISSYDTAHPEVTGITHHFLSGGFLKVAVSGLSSNGYLVYWDSTTKSFKAYTSGSVTAGTITASGTVNMSAGSAGSGGVADVMAVSGTALVTSGGHATITGATFTGSPSTLSGVTAGAGAEASASTNVGTVGFIAVGQRG